MRTLARKVQLQDFLLDQEFRLYREELFKELYSRSYLINSDTLLRSGKASKDYFDARQTSLTSRGSALIGHLFLHIIHKLARDVKAIGGLTMGADPLVCATTTIAGVTGSRVETGFLIRKEEKRHGIPGFIVGGNNLKTGDPVAICDDVITSGGSIRFAIAIANKHTVGRARRHRSLDVQIALALIDREEGGLERVQRTIPQTIALFRRSEFARRKAKILHLCR